MSLSKVFKLFDHQVFFENEMRNRYDDAELRRITERWANDWIYVKVRLQEIVEEKNQDEKERMEVHWREKVTDEARRTDEYDEIVNNYKDTE